jgi:tRNA (cytosine49-C5)-methyltransferase
VVFHVSFLFKFQILAVVMKIGKNTETTLKTEMFIDRCSRVFNTDKVTTTELLTKPIKQSMRINTLASDKVESIKKQLSAMGWKGKPFDWCDSGYSIDDGFEAIRDSELIKDGSIYIQNASSWLPVIALDPQTNQKILDICSAPGGKTSHIAQITNNNAELWINDSSKSRLIRAKVNLRNLGTKYTHSSIYDARVIAHKLNGQMFDRVLLDAPCSGEGLISPKSEKDMNYWSLAHIKRMQQLQKKSILQAWKLVRPGGVLVYSTCTIAPEENELVIDYLLERSNALLTPVDIRIKASIPPIQNWKNKQLKHDLSACLRISPSDDFEAFFLAKLTKPLQT